MYILASASPRRRELFGLISDDFRIVPSNAEETAPDGIAAENLPEYLARLKAGDIAAKYPFDTVIGADTVVILDGKVLGKPENKEDAVKMLKALSGKKHKVVTGCAVCKNGACRSFSSVTEVEFYPLDDKEISDYVATGEPLDKAGAYGIQGRGALFVKSINGDYFNVVGLPVATLRRFIE